MMEEDFLISKLRLTELLGSKNFLSKIKDLGVSVDVEGNLLRLSSESATAIMQVKMMLTAFNRGFHPNIAMLLLDEAYELAVIDISDYSQSKRRQIQMKSRIIGTQGRIKKRLSQATSCYISVYGKTISVIGTYSNVGVATEAIGMLLKGAEYSHVFARIPQLLLNNYGNS